MPLIAITGLPAILISSGIFAAQPEMVLLGDGRGQHRGDARIHRVAALLENAVSRLDLQAVAGADHLVRAADRREHRMWVLGERRQRGDHEQGGSGLAHKVYSRMEGDATEKDIFTQRRKARKGFLGELCAFA